MELWLRDENFLLWAHGCEVHTAEIVRASARAVTTAQFSAKKFRKPALPPNTFNSGMERHTVIPCFTPATLVHEAAVRARTPHSCVEIVAALWVLVCCTMRARRCIR
jgi:hypothetical protein